MATNTKNITATLGELNKHTQAARDELAKLDARYSELQAERESLYQEKVGKSDWAETVCKSIDDTADFIEEQMKNRFYSRARESSSFRQIEDRQKPSSRNAVNHMFGHPLTDSMDVIFADTEDLPANVFAWLYRDELKRRATETIMASEKWPFEGDRPLAEMRSRLAKIGREMAAIESDRAQLRAALAKFNPGA